MTGQDRMMSHRDEMEMLLPFYLNGTLEGAELAAVEEWLGSHPEAAAALERAEAEFSATSAANEAIRPPVDALSRFSKALEEVAGPAPAAAAPSLLTRLWHRFMDIPATVAWGAAAAAFALLVVQAVVAPGNRVQDFELAGAGDTDSTPFLLVTFRPDAQFGQVVEFLDDQGAAVLEGPGAGGVFKIGVPAARTDADYERIMALVAAQPFAQNVLPGRRPPDGG